MVNYNSPPPQNNRNHQLPSSMVTKEFGEVNVRNTGTELVVTFTILMELQGQEAEGWQTGIALDASSSMKGAYGRQLNGKIPPDVIKVYEKKGWIESRQEDGKKVKSFQKEAYEDAIEKGYLKPTENVVQSCAQQFTSYLASHLDVKGGTSLIYWACGDGSQIEVLGDFTEEQCQSIDVVGPGKVTFGINTFLKPALQYFIDRFKDARRLMCIFITDGKIDDLDAVKSYTVQLAQEIVSGQRNLVKCILIGVGEGIDKTQLEELDDLHTGTDVDIWDYKVAQEMRALVEIFSELVDENQIVAETGAIIYDSNGNVAKRYADALPAKIMISLPLGSQWFELEIHGQRIRQNLLMSRT